jgi:hypothetical protein
MLPSLGLNWEISSAMTKSLLVLAASMPTLLLVARSRKGNP